MPTINVGNLENQEEILDYLKRIYANVFDVSAIDWQAFFNARATGELFSTKFYNLSVTNTAQGEKMNDSIGKECTPSTNLVKNRDDFASFNAFWFCYCNFIVSDDGQKTITAIQGQKNFSRTGKVNVGILTPPLYYGISKVSDGEIWHLSDKPNRELGLVLMPHCKDNKGKEMPYGVLPVYYAGDIDGKLYGSSGLPVKNFISYMSLHTEMSKLGTGYVGAGSERSIYLKTMLRIKYAFSSSQKVFQGNTANNQQIKVATAIENVTYFPVSASYANGFYVGEDVSIGDATGHTDNLDRGNSYMRNIADKVLITKIETESDEIVRIYVDVETPFNLTADSYLSTMPLHSGTTDDVLGNDGYIANDGKHAFKLQGLEEEIGAYMVSSNEVMNKETATKTVFYHKNYGDYHSDNSILTNYKKIGEFTKEDSTDFWIGEVDIDLETGAEVPRTIGSGDSVGTGDRYYFGGTGIGFREYLTRGNLRNWSDAGLSCLYGGSGLSHAGWYCAVCVS